MMKSAIHGFTLVELIVTLAIAAIILAIGLPQFQVIRQKTQLKSSQEELVQFLRLARSTAIEKGIDVTVCDSSDGINCENNSGTWQNRLIMRNDANDEVLGIINLNQHTGLNSNRNTLSYSASGWGGGGMSTLTLCHDNADYTDVFGITIAISGRIEPTRTDRTSASCP